MTEDEFIKLIIVALACPLVLPIVIEEQKEGDEK